LLAPRQHKLIFVFHNLRGGGIFSSREMPFRPAIRLTGHKLIAASIKRRTFRRHFADVNAT
jgi:hypothetical protein